MPETSDGSAAADADSIIIIDGLNGSLLTPAVIAGLRRSGVTAINLTAVGIAASLDRALRELALTIETVQRHEGELMLVRDAIDIERAKASGRVGIILGMQDLEPIGLDLHLLRVLREIGVRIIQITHNRQCYTGTGCVEPDSGLTRFGRRVVEEMNRLGLVIDLSHCGPQTTLDAIRHSAAPVLCSHANPSALCPSPRNKSDAIIRALAERGGVLGVSAWSPLLRNPAGRRPTIADMMRCFDHVIGLVGVEHVAIGSDWCEALVPTAEAWAAVYGPQGSYPEVTGGLGPWYAMETAMAEGLETADRLPRLVAALARGHAGADLRRIAGLNLMRVFAAATAGR